MEDREPLQYFVEVGGRQLEVREIDGREAMSSLFRFGLRFTIPDGPLLDPDELVKTAASIHLRRGPLHVRSIAGIVTDVAVKGAIRGVPEVRLVIEPRLALARYRTDIRVFRDRTVPEMAVEVLSAVGVVPELRLRGEYARRPYCVQHRESDLDYVARLLEDEGIYYYFLESGAMVLGDSPSAYDSIAGAPVLPFHAGLGMDRNQDAVWSVGRRAALSVGKVSLRDFDPEHPSLDMDVAAAGPSAAGPEFYDYPGEYGAPAEGRRKARLMAESFACQAASIRGRSFCGRLLPGHTYSLDGAPEGMSDGEQVVTAVVHAFRREGSGFSCDFEALPSRLTYRPPRQTPVPRLTNPLTGIVTGAPGDDIHTDEAGRVKVHFHWDRRRPYDDDCSHWIPVLQDNTGHSVAIPRVGWEVLVHFLEGDPDRPVVLGRVYNAADAFPQLLPERKTSSALRSVCSPGRDGTNEIQFEDRAGAEHISVHAERDQNVVVVNDRTEDVLANEVVAVHRDEVVEIGRDHTEQTSLHQSIGVARDQTLSVGADRTRTVGGADTGNVTGNRTLTIGGMHTRRIGTDDSATAKKLVETVGGIDLEASVKSNTMDVARAMGLVVGGAVVEVAVGAKSEASGRGRVEAVGGVLFTKAGKEIKARADQARILAVGGGLSVMAEKNATLTGAAQITIEAESVSLTAATDALLKVGEHASIAVKDGVAHLDAKSSISLNITGPNQQGAARSSQI